MKRFASIIVLLLSAVCLFAADDGLKTLGATSKVITAFKQKMTDDVPAPEVQFRILDSNDTEFFSNFDLDIPLNARNTEYSAFSWVFSGNIFGAVTVTFTFSPMYKEGLVTNTIIPYDIELQHTQSRIGNTPIAVNKETQAKSYITNSFTTYKFKYADSVTGMAKKSVTTSDQSFAIVYNMNNANTQIVTADGVDAKSLYTLSVCDHWNRYGAALVTLKITAAGTQVGNNTKFSDGVYYADVIVRISVN